METFFFVSKEGGDKCHLCTVVVYFRCKDGIAHIQFCVHADHAVGSQSNGLAAEPKRGRLMLLIVGSRWRCSILQRVRRH